MSSQGSSSISQSETGVWVVGIDGSADAGKALQWAIGAARDRSVRLRAVAAWQYPSIGMLPVEGGPLPAAMEGWREAIEREAGDLVELAAAETQADIETVTVNGSPARVLLAELDTADLAVVGCRGRGGFKRLLLGSVSHQVATHARRPVIIVPRTYEPGELEHVVIGVDGSANSFHALRWALDFAPATAQLTAVGVWDHPTFGSESVDANTWNALREQAEAAFTDAVERFEQEAATPGRFQRAFESGHPGQVLVRSAADADLIVVGERGHHGFMGAVLGSVTTWVIHDLPCPAAVIPAAPATELG